VFQTPVDVPAGTELGALGAAIAAAVAAGCYPDYRAAVAAMVRVDRRQTPDPARAAIYERKYKRYKNLLDALAPLWRELG
jgi:L-xylulokinase